MYPPVKPLPSSLKNTVLFNKEEGLAPAIDPRETGELVETKYDTNVDFVANRDYQDIRAARQGNWEAFGNIMARNIGKLGTRTIDGAAFLFAAPINLINESIDGNVNSFGTAVSALVDNPVSQAMRGAEDWFDKQLPVYQSKLQDRTIDVTSMGFLDKVMNGLAYVGSMALGTGAVNAIPKLARMAGGASKFGKLFANAIEEGKDLNYITNLFKDSAALSDELGRISTLKKTSNAIRENFNDFYAGIVESAAEASQTKEETANRLREQMLAQNNGQPLTELQEKAINQQASEALTANFGLNLLMTTSTNRLLFHKMLNGKWADDMKNYNKVARNGDSYVAQEAANKVGKYQKLFQPVKKLATGAIGTGIRAEGGQELGQFATNDFLVNLYSNPDPDSIYKVDQWAKSGLETIKNLGSKDAMESALIGSIIGGGMGAVFNRGQDAKRKENTDRLIANANLVSSSNAIKEMAKNIKFSDAAEGALINGDRVTYETLKAAQVYDWVNSRDNLGRFSDVKADLEEARALPLQSFKEKYDIQDADYTEEKRNQFIDYISNIADKTKAAKDRLMSNYGHKLTELEKENPDITGFLTMIDVLKDDYTQRESDLLTKLSPYMNYEDLVENRLTPEKMEEYTEEITRLQAGLQQVQARPANNADELKARTESVNNILNKINTIQNTMAKSATEANYKELLQVNLPDEKIEKKANEKTRYAEYTKDLEDFKKIQSTKEQLINYYSKIVNDVDYAKQVQAQINSANQSEILDNVFGLNLNVKETPKLDNSGAPILYNGRALNDYSFENPEAGTKGTIQDYITVGDIYNLHRRQVKSGTWEDIDTYAPYEITGTSVEMVNGIPVGKINLEGQRGDKLTLTANQFKASIRPFVDQFGNAKYKYNQEAENVRFYKMFKDRAIKYNYNGKDIVGMLGFSNATRNAEDLVLKYYDEDGKLKNVTFNTSKFKGDSKKGYVKILSERETLAYKLNRNAKGYMNFLLKNVDSKNKSINTVTKKLADLQNRLKTAELNDNVKEKNAIVRAINSYSKFIEKLQENRDFKQAAAERLPQYENINIEKLDDLGEDLNKTIDKVLEYQQANLKLSENKDSEGKTPKQIKSDKVRKAFQVELDQESTTIDALNEELDSLKQQFVTSVSSLVSPEQASIITNPEINPDLDFQYIEALKTVEDFAATNAALSDFAQNANEIANLQELVDDTNNRINERISAIEEEYLGELLSQTNISPEDLPTLKAAEIAAITKFTIFINQRGFFPSNKKYDRKPAENNNALPTQEEQDTFVTRRPQFVLKTTGNSNTVDSISKKEFYKNIHKLEVDKTKARVATEDEYARLGLTSDPNAIYLVVTDEAGKDLEYNGNKLVTTLPLPSLTDSYGFRFSNFQSGDGSVSPVKKEIGERIDAAINNKTGKELFDSLTNIQETLKSEHPNESAFIDSAINQLTDLANLRQQILDNKGANIKVNVIGKSNGIANISSSDNYKSTEAFTPTGKIIIPESGTTHTSGDVTYNTVPGRAYFEDIATRTFFPVVTDRLGNKTIQSKNNKSTGISFVDNIINAGKFVQASLSDAAFDEDGTPVKASDAYTKANNMLSYITYTNKNVDKPEAMFQYSVEDQEVVFYIGSNTPLRLSTEEETIRQLLGNKIFNIDRKSLESEKIKFELFQASSDGTSKVSGAVWDNYQNFIKNNFGITTNIVPNKNGALYSNGYLVLDNKASVLPKSESVKAVETSLPATLIPNKPETPPATSEDGPSEPIFPGEETIEEMMARMGVQKIGGFGKAADSAKSIIGKKKGKTDRLLTKGTYKGDITRTMSRQQLESAREKFFNKYGVAFDIVKGLIDNDAFGKVTKYAEVLLSDKAPIGTDYHEEFHLVSQHILDEDQLRDLYAEWRAKNNPEATDDQVEEELAEAFRLHALGYTGFTGKIKQIFDYLLNAIKKLLNIDTLQDTIFNDIYSGKYYGRNTYVGSKDFKATVGDIFPYDQRQKAYRGATRQLVYALIDSYAKNEIAGSTNITDAQRVQALNRLATDKDARLDYLNYVDSEGNSFFTEMITDALQNYIDAVSDPTTAQMINYVNTIGADDLINEFTAFVSKELNLKGLEESDIDENTTGRDIVKKGDNEIDFFNEAVTQMRLLAYTQPSLNPDYPINPAALVKIYIDNLADSKNSQDFEDKLKILSTNPSVVENFDRSYPDAINNINNIIGLNNSNRTKEQQFMMGNMWSSFAKISTDFRILKVADAEQGFGIDYYWVDASKEASSSATKRDLTNTIKDNYTAAKQSVQSTDTNAKKQAVVSNPDLVFTELFGIPADKFKAYNPNKIQSIANAIARSSDINSYLANNSNDINTVVEFITENSPEKVFSFFNAGGKLQHGLQNPTSLFYRMRDISKDSDILSFEKSVVLNGVQKTLTRDRVSTTSDSVTEDDLHILFFNSFVTKNKVGAKAVMPFIFSGDKGTLAAIEFTPKYKLLFGNSLKTNKVNGITEYSIDHSDIYREYLKDEIEDLDAIVKLNKKETRIGSAKSKVKEELPFFSFLKTTNPILYNGLVKDVQELGSNSEITTETIYNKYINDVLTETQAYFKNKGTQIKSQFENMGFDYKSVISANDNTAKGLEDAYLNWYASAYAVGIQEQTKLVGSLAFYDQPAKRIPAWNGTKRPIRTDEATVNWYNKTYNSNIDINRLKALVLNDVKTQKDIKDAGLYDDNNPADAQAYISLDAARFLLFSSGSYSFRLDDLFREMETLENKSNLTATDIDRLNTFVTELNEYMNVLKPQYYGMQQLGNLEVPTFYKFSVLPLSKAISQGRNLDHIRELMARPDGPHLVMFDSANKVGRKYSPGLDLYDEEGNYIFNNTPITDKIAAIQESSWEGLGIQVDMPKAHETVTFGTQMRKLISVDLQGLYNINGSEWNPERIRTHIDNLIVKKVEQDKADLMKRLGLDNSLNITPNKVETVKKELVRQAVSRDMPNTVINGIKALTSFDFIGNKAKFQQLVNSIVSKGIIKQTMTGDAKAMVSSVGFEKKNGGIQADKRLKFYKKGVNSYMEVLLPFNMKDQYSDYVEWNEQQNMFIFKANAPIEIKKLIGYRIPTQSPASIENIQIKGFLPAGYGNAIVVPFELTSKAGSDFDIDKLNLFLPKFKYKISDNKLSQELNKLPDEYFENAHEGRLAYYNQLQETLYEDLEPTDIAILKYIKDNVQGNYEYADKHIDNQIIQFFTDLMSSPQYFDNFVTTIDSNDFSKLAKEIGNKRGLQKSAADEKNSANFYDPLYNAKRRYSFMSAKETLGAAALATTHHAESQKHGLAINSTKIENGKYARVVKGGEAIATIGELLSIFEPNIVVDGKVRLDRIYNFENKKISDILSQIVNASVDAAKDDYITSANLDIETIGVAALMIRTGIPIDKVFNFLSQPGVIKYTNALRKVKIAALRGTNKGSIKDKYNSGNYTKITSVNGIATNIINDNNIPDVLSAEQANFVDLYKQLDEYGQLLTDLQQVTNFDTKGTGSMLEENEMNLLKYDKFMFDYSRMFTGLDTMTDPEKSFTARMREEARNANNLNNSLFKLGEFYTGETPIIKELKDTIEGLYKDKGNQSEKVYNIFKLKNYFNSYILQRVAISNDPNFNTIVPRTIAKVKSYTGNNEFIKRLRAGDNKLFMHGGANVQTDEANLLSESFTELYNNPITNSLATDIALSGLYQFGLVNNPSTIMNVIPTDILMDILKLSSTDPLVEGYNKVKQLDGSLAKAVNNAKDHALANKGDNHFSNFVLKKPEQQVNTFNLAKEDPRDC